MLAGIPNSPNNYSPIINETKAKQRQKVVLDSMVKNKFITESESDNAYNTKLTYYGHFETNNSKIVLKLIILLFSREKMHKIILI